MISKDELHVHHQCTCIAICKCGQYKSLRGIFNHQISCSQWCDYKYELLSLTVMDPVHYAPTLAWHFDMNQMKEILFALMFSMKALAKHEKTGECNPKPCNRKLTQQQIKPDKRRTRLSYMTGSWKIFHVTIQQSHVLDFWQKHHEYLGYGKSLDYEMLKTSAGKYSSCEWPVRACQNLDLMGEWQAVTSTYQTFSCALQAWDMPACNWNGTN